MKDKFQAAANANSTWKREALPDPAKIADRGIKTRESLEWMRADHPQTPHLTHELDQENLRQAALEEERQIRRESVERMRQEFRARPEKARRDFRTARDYRGIEQER